MNAHSWKLIQVKLGKCKNGINGSILVVILYIVLQNMLPLGETEQSVLCFNTAYESTINENFS